MFTYQHCFNVPYCTIPHNVTKLISAQASYFIIIVSPSMKGELRDCYVCVCRSCEDNSLGMNLCVTCELVRESHTHTQAVHNQK